MVGEEGGRLVEAARGGGEPADGPVRAVPAVLSGHPARVQRRQGLLRLLGDGEERRTAWAEQELEAARDRVVVGSGVQRQPARGLGGVEEDPGAVRGGRRANRVEVGDPAVGGLYGGEGDQRGRGPHRLGQAVQRGVPHPQIPTDREGADDRAELSLGYQHFGTRLQRGSDQTDMDGDRAAGGDPVGTDTDEPGEPGPCGVHGVEAAGARTGARGVLVGERLHRLDGAVGQQPAAGGVEIRGLGSKLGGYGLGERGDLHASSLNAPQLIVNHEELRGTPSNAYRCG